MISKIRFLARLARKQPFFFSLNILGMTLGLTAFFLINTYTHHQLSFNQSHQNYHQLFRLTTKITNAGNETHFAISPKIGIIDFVDFFPQVEAACRINREPGTISVASRQFEGQNILFADSSFYQLFTTKLVAGDIASALSDISSLVISDSAAVRYFGRVDVLDESLEVQTGRVNKTMKIAAIVRQPPNNTNIRYDVIGNFKNVEETFGPTHGHVGAINSFVLASYSSIEEINQNLETFYEEKLGPLNGIISYSLQPLKDLYFDNTLSYDSGTRGNKTNIHLLVGLSVFLLALSCLNFMNLSTAAAVHRTKEIGIRKALGESRKRLIFEAYFETFVMVGLSMVLGCLFTMLLLPWLDDFVGISVSEITIPSQVIIPFFAILWIILVLVSGSYLALYLSGKALAIARHQEKSANLYLKKGLIALQYMIAAVSLSGVFIVHEQLGFLQKKELGYQSDNILSFIVNIPGVSLSKKEALQAGIQQVSGVGTASLTLSQLSFEMPRLPVVMDGDSASNFQVLNYHEVDDQFLNTFRIQLLSGRAFRATDSAKFIVNESAAAKLGFGEPEAIVGQYLTMGEIRGQVIGLVPDFHFQSLHFVIQPLILSMTNAPRRNFLSVRAEAGDHETTLEAIESVWNEHLPNALFEYRYLSDINEAQYEDEEQLSDMLNYTTVIIVIISLLGIIGLMQFTAQGKVREIGIRKVLGASVNQIIFRLGNQIILLVVVGNLIAIPLTWNLADNWLQEFPYTGGISPWSFVLSALISLGFSALSISQIVWKSANGNIVAALRHE